jgi:hypothetical protein
MNDEEELHWTIKCNEVPISFFLQDNKNTMLQSERIRLTSRQDTTKE